MAEANSLDFRWFFGEPNELMSNDVAIMTKRLGLSSYSFRAFEEDNLFEEDLEEMFPPYAISVVHGGQGTGFYNFKRVLEISEQRPDLRFLVTFDAPVSLENAYHRMKPEDADKLVDAYRDIRKGSFNEYDVNQRRDWIEIVAQPVVPYTGYVAEILPVTPDDITVMDKYLPAWLEWRKSLRK
ncbi:MAG: hypothetical protein WCV90_08040 [Candidatus Woesearchaeota archaeon]|jgi:hypothetical protein